MFLQDLHCRIALSTLFFVFALGTWGAVNFVRVRGVSSNYLGALVIGEILLLLQGILGLILVLMGQWPADSLHFLYGVTIAISWPGVYAYTHAETSRREMGIYSIVSFFMFGLAVRAMMTGAGPAGAACLPH
jgi:heme A synthase